MPKSTPIIWPLGLETNDEKIHAYNLPINIGVMYAGGEGVREDDAGAARWYRLTAEQRHAAATTALRRVAEQREAERRRVAEAEAREL